MADSQQLDGIVRAGTAEAEHSLEWTIVAPEFDADYYASEYPDLALPGDRRLAHFCEVGWFEGRNPNAFFDTVHYLQRYRDVALAGMNPFFHYLFHGRHEARETAPAASPSGRSLLALGAPVFDWVERMRAHVDPAYYLARLGAVPAPAFDPAAHFAFRGWREGRDPSASLSLAALIRQYPQAAALLLNPVIAHAEALAGRYHPVPAELPVAQEPSPPEPAEAPAPEEVAPVAEEVQPEAAPALDDIELVRGAFDAAFYLRRNPDVAAAGIDPLEHYFYTGWREGRDPTPDFSSAFYLDAHEDVRESGANPFAHYLATGQGEGRSARPPEPAAPTAASEDAERIALIRTALSEGFYLSQNKDVLAAGIDPVEHYYFNGWREGRNPTKHFDTRYYLEANEDVRELGLNPFWHYLVAGRQEGRAPVRPGGYRRRILDAARDPQARTADYRVPDVRPLGGASLGRRLDAALKGCLGIVVSASHDCYVKVIGGTQIFIADEQKRFAERGYAYIHVSPLKAQLCLSEPERRLMVQVVIDGKAIGAAPLAALAARLGDRRRDDARPGVFVVHSALGFDVEGLCALHDALAPAHSVYWLHDYSSLCEGFNLLRNDMAFCGLPAPGSMACRVCVYGEGRRTHSARIQALFEHCRFQVASPSAFTLDLWQSRTTLPAERAFALPHWVLKPRPAKRRSRAAQRSGSKVRVGFVGFPASGKGWQIFSEVVDRFAEDGRYAFYHFAAGGTASLPEAEFVVTEVTPDNRRAAARLLEEHDIDYLAMLSPWPETFSFVAHEGVAAGCTLLCLADSGNVVALARETGRGLVFDGPRQLLDFLDSPEGVRHAERARRTRTTYEIVEAGTTASIPHLFAEGERA